MTAPLQTVWKYPVPEGVEFELEMPIDTKLLTLHHQGDELFLWARVTPTATMVKFRFQWVGTGHVEVPATAEYVGTVHLPNLGIVLHLFRL